MQQTSKTEEDIWAQITNELSGASIPLQYKMVFTHHSTPVTMLIDMDPGGGFEGGFEFTSLSAPVPVQFTALKANVPNNNSFRFALHEEGFIDRVGKFFGMEDVLIGYPEFDKQLVVKTNDAEKIKVVFSDTEVRKVFQSLNDFTLQVISENEDQNYSLELMIDKAVTDPVELRRIYNAFIGVLNKLQS